MKQKVTFTLLILLHYIQLQVLTTS